MAVGFDESDDDGAADCGDHGHPVRERGLVLGSAHGDELFLALDQLLDGLHGRLVVVVADGQIGQRVQQASDFVIDGADVLLGLAIKHGVSFQEVHYKR